MDEIKLGIIGLGNMGSEHIGNVYGGNIKNIRLTAICDIDEGRLAAAKAAVAPEVALFDSDEVFFANADIDAVLIAVPHYFHPVLANTAFRRGLHVMIEKPAGVYTKAVREMNENAKASGRVFGIMFNCRTRPEYKKMREIIKRGDLGGLKRIVWLITNWYRPQAYHDSCSWRSTWAEEGGGVLINQAPHNLDLMQWMVGMPKRIRAFCDFGKYYDIEVEDDVTAYMQYEGGMTGLLVTTTGEQPGTDRLEISGNYGKLVLENGNITFYKTVIGEREFNKTNEAAFPQIETWKCEVPYDANVSVDRRDHTGMMNNFARAILYGEELIAPGYEGIRGLTLSNAMHLSAWTDGWVDLPINEDLYYEKLQEHIKNSTIKKKTSNKSVEALTGSFH